MPINMPLLRPVSIRTKTTADGKKIGLFKRILIWLSTTRQWQVAEHWRYPMRDIDGTRYDVVIPKGFIFDGASIPRPLWPLLSPIGLLLIPGLIHDFGYRYDYLWVFPKHGGKPWRFRHKAGQKYWDKAFMRIGNDVNGMALIDYLAWLMLALFGCFAWNNNRAANTPEIDFEAGLTLQDIIDRQAACAAETQHD